MEQVIEGAIAHVLCDYAEEFRLIAHTENLNYVVEPGLVQDLCFFQQTVSFPVKCCKHMCCISHELNV